VQVAKPAPAPVVPATIPAPVAPVAASRTAVPGEIAAPVAPAVIKDVSKSYAKVGAVHTTHQNVRAFTSAWAKRKAGRPAGVIITGPAGTAKTRLAQEFAATQGVPFLKVDGASIQTANDWYGQFVPAAGGFEWAWTPLALALQRGEPMVILVDEINRVENERALNGLLGLLDFTGTYTPVGAPSAVTLPPGILVVATLNEGVEYVGTVEVDAAVRDRFGLGARMDYPVEPIEVRILTQEAPGIDKEVAKRLVRIANSQRGKRHDDTLYPSGNVISTRVLISVAEDITLTGATPSEALWTAIRGRFAPEDEPARTVLIEAQFGATPVDASTLADDDDLEQMLAADD
jgi:midasin (ATPase involved in ribosome maturation)